MVTVIFIAVSLVILGLIFWALEWGHALLVAWFFYEADKQVAADTAHIREHYRKMSEALRAKKVAPPRPKKCIIDRCDTCGCQRCADAHGVDGYN